MKSLADWQEGLGLEYGSWDPYELRELDQGRGQARRSLPQLSHPEKSHHGETWRMGLVSLISNTECSAMTGFGMIVETVDVKWRRRKEPQRPQAVGHN